MRHSRVQHRRCRNFAGVMPCGALAMPAYSQSTGAPASNAVMGTLVSWIDALAKANHLASLGVSHQPS
jgi:hypothetical protein